MSRVEINASTELEARDALNRLYNGRDLIVIASKYGTDEDVIFHATRDYAAQVNYYSEAREQLHPGLAMESAGPDCDGHQPARNLDQDLAIEFLMDCQYTDNTAYFVER